MIMNVSDIDTYCYRGIKPSAPDYFTAPFNDTCLENFFQELQVRLRRYTDLEESVYTIIYVVISVLATIGNFLVILVVIRKKSMRTNRNVLILNLALSNLVLAITNIPFLWLPSIEFEFPYTHVFCKLANVLPGSNIYCSTLTISVMAIDRYYSVKRLTLTSNRQQWTRAIGVAGLIWVMSFILSLPLLLSYDIAIVFIFKDVAVFDAAGEQRVRSYGWRQCRIAPASTAANGPHTVQLLMSVLQALFLYVIPIIVLSIFNVKLTRFLKHNANQMSRNRIDRGSKEARASPTERGRLGGDNGSLSKVRAGTAERASERRTSRTTALLMAMAASYAVLWLPFTIVTMLIDLGIGFSDDDLHFVERIDQTCKVISMLSICVNPFLYGFLNTNFRHEFSAIYYDWVRCGRKLPPRFPSGPAHEYSSVAYPTRRGPGSSS